MKLPTAQALGELVLAILLPTAIAVTYRLRGRKINVAVLVFCTLLMVVFSILTWLEYISFN
jgi:hypothetical protein